MGKRTLLGPEAIQERLADLPGWEFEDGRLRKTFRYPDHIIAMGFVTRVAICAEVLDHHPELRILYSTVDIASWTHDAGGVTEMDFRLAQKIEQYS